MSASERRARHATHERREGVGLDARAQVRDLGRVEPGQAEPRHAEEGVKHCEWSAFVVLAASPLSRKIKVTAVMPGAGARTGAPSASMMPVLTQPAMTAMQIEQPMAPVRSSLRRPRRSMSGSARQPARKYSVPGRGVREAQAAGSRNSPFTPASRRDISCSKPSEFSRRVLR